MEFHQPLIVWVYQHILYFSIYAGMGWLLEVAFRSIRERRFVNAGFLRGPFLPIYGMGTTCVLLLAPWVQTFGLIGEFFAFAVVMTIVEYAVGCVCEKAFGVRMWDYSDDPLNWQGKICLPFTVLWGCLAMGFSRWLHPPVADLVTQIPFGTMRSLAWVLVAYLLLDFAFSINLLRHYVGRLARIHLRRTPVSFLERSHLIQSFERLLVAFPNLRKYLDTVANFRSQLDGKVSALQTRFLRFVEARSPREEEFRGFVRDIASHPEFIRTKLFRHHDSSIYRHALRVSCLSYRVGKSLHLDARAMARGGLLHDFFLYDWRDHDLPDLAKSKFHGLAHPRIALGNAKNHFCVTALEGDIIVKHMWPLTLYPPRHMESFLVGCIDKYVAVYEFGGLHWLRRNRQNAKRRNMVSPPDGREWIATAGGKTRVDRG